MSSVKRKKKKKLKKLLKHKAFRLRNIISLFQVIMTLIIIIFLIVINIFPFKYILLISLLLLIIDAIGIIFINTHNKLYLKVIGGIITGISIILSCIILYFLSNTNTFINETFMARHTYSKNTYYVISKNTNYLKETDIMGEISTYRETVNLQEAIEKLNDKYQVKEKQYDDIGLMFDGINNDIDRFILIEKSSYEIVFSILNTIDKNDYDILYEFDLFTKRSSNEDTTTDKFNIFIGGADFANLMDFNMIASVNIKTHKVVFTSIPKDYYIEVVGKDGRFDKLSFMNAYGENTNKESLEKLFNIKIDYTVILDTNSLVKLVDYIGGIDYCSEYDFTTTHALVTDSYNDNGRKLNIVKGCQHLDGVETLTVARERNALFGRDRERQENCQKIFMAIIKKFTSTDTMFHYNQSLNTLSSSYETNIPKKSFSKLMKDILNNKNKWVLETQSVDGIEDYGRVHLSELYDIVMYPDYFTVEAASNKMNEILN